MKKYLLKNVKKLDFYFVIKIKCLTLWYENQ